MLNLEFLEVFRRKVLANSATSNIPDKFPMGEGWVNLILRFELTVVIGTGTGAISEGELQFIKGISISTDKGDRPYTNVPARFLYRFDSLIVGAPAAKNAIAAADGVYVVEIPVWFYNPKLARPYDTILDTSRFKNINLGVQLGSVADLFTSVGNSAVSTTLTCYVRKTRQPLQAHELPRFMIEMGHRASVNPANAQEIDLEIAANLAYMQVMLFTANSATTGVPFSGTANGAVISEFTLETSRGNLFDRVLADVINKENKQDYGLESVITGMYICDLVRDGDPDTALYAGPDLLSRLKMKWTNDTLSTSGVTCGYVGYRPMK